MKHLLLFALLFTFSLSIGQTVDSNHVDGRLYVKLKDTATIILEPYAFGNLELNDIINQYGISAMPKAFNFNDAQLQRVHRFEFDSIALVSTLISELSNLDFVDYAEPAPLYSISSIPNEFETFDYWWLNIIDAPLAWDITTGNSSVVVAVVDNAVSITHEDLVPNLYTNTGETPNNGIDDDFNGYTDDIHGYDVADGDGDPSPPPGTTNDNTYSHGTHCAGIAVAKTNNGKGVASVGYNVNYMAVKCSQDDGEGALTSAYEGIDYALSAGADVISMSFGSPDQYSTWNLLSSSAESNGIVMVAAAGNNASSEKFYPAAYENVIAVAASDRFDKKGGFSNYGDWVDIMAPGVGIRSTLPEDDNSYGPLTGTSMACPMVAGSVALLKSAYPNLSVSEIVSILKSGSENVDAENPDFIGQYGAGRINVYGSMATQFPAGLKRIDEENTAVQVFPNPASSEVTIQLTHDSEYERLEIFSISGVRMHSGRIQNNRFQLTTRDWARGTYFIFLSSTKHSSPPLKMILQ